MVVEVEQLAKAARKREEKEKFLDLLAQWTCCQKLLELDRADSAAILCAAHDVWNVEFRIYILT